MSVVRIDEARERGIDTADDGDVHLRWYVLGNSHFAAHEGVCIMQAFNKLMHHAFQVDHPPLALGGLGPNGSGKSSVEWELGIGDSSLLSRVRNGRAFWDESTQRLGIIYVNADDIVRTLRKKDPNLSVDAANRDAQERADRLRRELVSARADFAWESVASHPSKLEFIKEMKSLGYFIATILVSTEDPAINVRRVAGRVRRGGHDVPSEKIVNRYYRFSNLMYDYFQASDFLVAFDNSRDACSVHDPSARLVLVKDGNSIEVVPGCDDVTWVNRYILDKLGSS